MIAWNRARWQSVCLLPLVLVSVCMAAEGGQITGVTVLQGGEGVMVRFAGPPVMPRVETLSTPNRLVLDFETAVLTPRAPKSITGEGILREIRLGAHKGKARVVADFQDHPVPKFEMEPVAEGFRITFTHNAGETSNPSPPVSEPPALKRKSPQSPAGAQNRRGNARNPSLGPFQTHQIDVHETQVLPQVIPGMAPDETVNICGRSVTLVSVQLKLTHCDPEHVIPVLKCMFNKECEEYKLLIRGDPFYGLNVDPYEPSAQWRQDGVTSGVGLPVLPYDSVRAAARRKERRDERRLELSEEAAEQKTGAKTKKPPARKVAMDPWLKALIPFTTLWAYPAYKAVWVKDTVERIEAMRRIIAQLDVPRQQVLIEARVVQATREWSRGLGVVWGGRNNQQTSPVTAANRGVWGFTGTGGGGARTPSSQDSFLPRPGDISSDFVMNQIVNGTFTGLALQFGQIMGQYATDLDVRLNIGERANKARVVSRPKVQALSGTCANMETGLTIGYPTSSSLYGTQMQLVPVNLQLSVQPIVCPDGRVRMKITVTDNSLGPVVNQVTSIQTRASNTELIVRDGETCVIGGIVIQDRSNLRDGWPALMNLPIFNLFFSTNSRSDRTNELIVFITPTIVKRPPHAR